MVTYLDAVTAPLRNTGQIRLYGDEAFAGMRKACDLTARCLDALADIVKPGVTTDLSTVSCLNSAWTRERYPQP